VPPQPGFLQGLRALCDAHEALLILDEVMTGFRLALGGAQELYNVRADLTCLGKVLGGGLPVGAYGGRRDLMQHVAPLGPMYQAGTLSGNPLGMAAGLATLRVLKANPSIYQRLEFVGAEIESGLRDAIAASGAPACVQRVGSMLSVFFTPGPVECWDDADRCDRAAFGRFFHAMMAEGFALPPAQFEAWFLSAALEDAHLEALLEAARKAMG
jgi:glutamate-1-semialdehyde 2,1-aminomutase